MHTYTGIMLPHALQGLGVLNVCCDRLCGLKSHADGRAILISAALSGGGHALRQSRVVASRSARAHADVVIDSCSMPTLVTSLDGSNSLGGPSPFDASRRASGDASCMGGGLVSSHSRMGVHLPLIVRGIAIMRRAQPHGTASLDASRGLGRSPSSGAPQWSRHTPWAAPSAERPLCREGSAFGGMW